MEQGHDLCSSSSGCAEQAARVPGHAQSCLLWRGKAISQFICPGKTPAGKKEQREEVFRAAEGPAPKSEQGQRCCQLSSAPGEVLVGWQEQQGWTQLPPPRDLPSLLPPHTPASGRAASLERPEVTEAPGRAAAAAAPCRGAQGSSCPPGSPGPR